MNDRNIPTIVEAMMAPEEAVEAYPDECANCGAKASAFWIPNDYHERDPDARDPGLCTECGHHFGTGEKTALSTWDERNDR